MRRTHRTHKQLSSDIALMIAIAYCEPWVVKHCCTALPVAGAAISEPRNA
jgi:hypothetical protein